MNDWAKILAVQQTGRGPHGVVAASAPLAAALGAESMRAGGNAYDGVLTAALAETVLLPPKCGLAGDLVALRLRPGAAAPETLLAIGGAPLRLSETLEDGLPETGPLSVGVPAAPAGYAELARYARADRGALAAPARRLAVEGFCWSKICTLLTEEARDLLLTHNPGGTSYLPGGAPIAPGAVKTLPGLDLVLEEWVERGREFLSGPVGDAILRRVREAGGVLDQSDLSQSVTNWTDSERLELASGETVWATAAPTHGPSLLEVVSGLARASSIAEVWDAVEEGVASRRERLGDPRPAGTSIVSAADADGTVVVLVHSNSYPRYGSGLVIDEYDLILSNRAGRGFTPIPGHPNYPSPGKRPATTLHAWAYSSSSDRPQLMGGTPGGENQMPWNAQLIHQILQGERQIGHLVTAPRWEWLVKSGGARVEEGFPPEELAELRDRTDVFPVAALGLRCAQQVIRVPSDDGSAIEAAVDPRTGGTVVVV